MAFSPDSGLIVVGDARGVLHVLDLGRRQKVKELQVMRSPAHLVFDPGGTRLAVCGVQNPDVQVVEFDSGKILKTLPSGNRGRAFLASGRHSAGHAL